MFFRLAHRAVEALERALEIDPGFTHASELLERVGREEAMA